jgi:1,4-dihydroxy-2-naphthoate octaprenyltransferase
MARAFLRLCRFQFIIPGLVLYILGFLLATAYGSKWDLARFILGYMVFFCAHFSLTFSNDYFDQEADSKNTPTPLSGGSGVLQTHPELATVALWTSLILIVASLLLALLFQLLFAPPWYFLVMVVAGNLAASFYSAPPVRLAYRGLGEAATMIAAGLLMPGMGYLCASGALDWDFMVLTPAFLVYGAFFILSVEMPDVEGDRIGGKRNLMVRYGLRNGIIVSMFCVLTGSLLWIYLSVFSPSEVLDYRVLVIFSTIPLLAGLIGAQKRALDRNQVVRQVKLNFSSLLSFLLLINVYLVLIISQ